MKKIYFLLFFIAGALQFSFASVTPGDSILLKSQVSVLKTSVHSPILGSPKMESKKLTFADRLKLKLIKNKFFKTLVSEKGEPTEKQKKLGRLAMILGIASIPILFIPYVGIVAIPAAILALVLGIKSVKGNSNTQGIVGIVTGAISLFLVLIAVIYVATFFGG